MNTSLKSRILAPGYKYKKVTLLSEINAIFKEWAKGKRTDEIIVYNSLTLDVSDVSIESWAFDDNLLIKLSKLPDSIMIYTIEFERLIEF